MELSQAELKYLRFAGTPIPTSSAADRRLPAPVRAAPHLARTSCGYRGDEHGNPLSPFLHDLLTRAGLPPDLYRAECLERRLPACLRALRVPTAEAAAARIALRPDLVQVALEALLLAVTQLFRDPFVFTTLEALIPELHPAGTGLNVWSVGCSDGSELYSVAILLAEARRLTGSRLLGTDCRPHAIERARCGEFAAAALEAVAPVIRHKYFEPCGAGVRVRADLRAHTDFQLRSFPQEPSADACDLVLWRNAAIYLRPAAARRVWARLVESLRPSGLLVTGKAERPDGVLPLIRVANCIYRRARE